MLRTIHPRILRYGMAVFSVVVALLLTLILQPVLKKSILVIFFAAVAVSNWYGGFKPGLLATILAVLVSDYFFIPPIHSVTPTSWENAAQLVVFVFVSVLINSLNTELRIARNRSHASLGKAEAARKEVTNILESITDAFISFNDQWCCIYINEQALRLLHKTREELIGKQVWEEVFPHIFGDQAYRELHRAVNEQTTLVFEDFAHSMNIWLEIHAYPSSNGLAVYFRDITERKRADEERTQHYEESQRANRVKDEFLAMLSHELRSPLNAILGWSQLLRSGKLNPEITMRALETIERNAKLQTQLIEDLLDVSRILRGNISLNAFPINPALSIEAAIDTMRLAAEAKSIQILPVIESNIGMISGDSNRLQQIVWNLLSNAIKFTSPGGRVEIRLAVVSSQVQIQVSDTGKGISFDFLPYVFDYFRQADASMSRNNGGLGLGLAIVRHLVELHGGTVCAESLGEEQGATFTVRFPLLKQQPVTNQIAKSLENPANINGVKVLVVDDDVDAREFLVFILEQHGAIALASASATEALERLEQFQPDVLLSDIGMPGEDGYNFIRRVRLLESSRIKQIPAIALTAYASNQDCQQALKAGFQRHIPKPVDASELITIVANLNANFNR